MKASIVIPTYNEEKNIAILLKRIRELYGKKYELIVVDDSTDKTYEIAKRYADKAIHNQVKRGKGYAMRVGFQNASNDVIVLLDADLSHLPEDIPKILEPFADKRVGVVIGSRILGGSDEYTFWRALGNTLVSGSFNFFFKTRLFDAVNGFKAYRKVVLNGLRVDGFDIEFEILGHCMRKGYAIKEVASHENARRFGQAHFHAFKNGMEFFFRIVREGVRYRLGMKVR